MLGTNSVGYSDGNYLANCMGELVQHISEITKAKVYVLSIPPITYYAEAAYDNALTTSAINTRNITRWTEFTLWVQRIRLC